MKKILSILTIVLLAAVSAIAQSPSPGIFNYQGVARNSVGNVLINQTIRLRLTVHDATAVGAVVYQESRTTVTNPFGLFNVQVGSAGATNVTGTIAAVVWGVNSKFIQVEIDPNGGTSFINIGTAQLASVPYSLYSSLSNDLVLPFLKTQANAGTLFRINNSGTGISGAIMGTTQSPAGSAWGVHGQVDNTAAGGFSTGVLGTNLSTTGSGIGVTGTQNGSGWGVYGTTPSGRGVYGLTTSGIGVFGESSSGIGVYGTSSTGRSGFFEGTNAASTVPVLDVTGNGAAPSRTIRAYNSGLGSPLEMAITNAANTNNVFSSTQTGLGRSGLIQITNAANASDNLELFTNGTGWAANIVSSNGTPRALRTVGGIRLTGIGEANNFILRSDATGNANWADPAALFPGAFLWTRVGTNLWNTNLGDNVGVGTNAPAYKLDIEHGGSTGIRSRSTGSFSVVDIDAASGDAALRFQKAGVGQWNTRNRPADDYYEIFELGGGGSRFVIQDGTGNVGIGATVSPSYKLDVEHGGSTGIRSKSTGSFSVVDIDAASGDAALRFAKAGVNQWNIRNRPADDYLEIFELGGGGSRVVIQDGTGNVGIGATVAPSYKLDVEHGGSTGLRVLSTASFSVIDIDAASGDAALRFARAGVNQWNTRNRPADDYYEIFELGGGGSRFVIQDGTGNVGIGQTVAPSYKLDVLHGGSTGLRVQSSASFSVVDIDAASGDAALRFIKAGVNKWNTRNEPVNDDYQWFELGGGGERMRIQRGTGNLGINQPNPTARLDVNGTFKLTDGTEGANKVLTSDASGNASWQAIPAGIGTITSSLWLSPNDAPSRDTTVDGTLTKTYVVLAPEITPAVIASGNISVYFRVGGIGPYELPYISNAGGRANAIQAILAPGKIIITRPTFNEVAPNNINLPGTLEFRYTIIQ